MPTLMLGLSAIDDVDPRHMAALCRVYNNWASAFCRGEPERFKFWAWVPRHDATLAAEEARRCVEELGAIGAAMPSPAVDGHLLSDDVFAPLYRELERLGVPLGAASGRRPRARRRAGALSGPSPHRCDAAHGRAPVLRGHGGGRIDPRRRLRRIPRPTGGGHGGRRELAAVAAVVDGRAVGAVRARLATTRWRWSRTRTSPATATAWSTAARTSPVTPSNTGWAIGCCCRPTTRTTIRPSPTVSTCSSAHAGITEEQKRADPVGQRRALAWPVASDRGEGGRRLSLSSTGAGWRA